ncbi:hypothetical protein SAMN04487885_11394 [Clostridium cadaveris]|uniref:Uncharacterized protein n=1 Tax=Clostridium cadaveris TaxID=1529 RepID=A0A1I2M943_9CLOT|nr:hypothetical protein [Clostridium cadaveris]NME63130.1 hypothetical protein [Clostridium cadaveris]NWK10112.1 hypothetical protein [Clostridium cadaveris]SFF87972.1 hypothetical protein SAMN04487885_11394 [Clostridium cadaveris]
MEKNLSHRCITIPCNSIDISIKRIEPYYICQNRPLFLCLRINDKCCIENRIKINIYPKKGTAKWVSDGVLVYIPNKCTWGYDFFQIMIQDECCRKNIENILIYIRPLCRLDC